LARQTESPPFMAGIVHTYTCVQKGGFAVPMSHTPYFINSSVGLPLNIYLQIYISSQDRGKLMDEDPSAHRVKSIVLYIIYTSA